jgi:hypothetical protein
VKDQNEGCIANLLPSRGVVESAFDEMNSMNSGMGIINSRGQFGPFDIGGSFFGSFLFWIQGRTKG